MRRKLFYYSVALLTFGLGLSLAIKFYSVGSDNVVLHSVPPVREAEEKFDAQILSEKREVKSKCENPYLLAVWNRLQRDADYQELFDKIKRRFGLFGGFWSRQRD